MIKAQISGRMASISIRPLQSEEVDDNDYAGLKSDGYAPVDNNQKIIQQDMKVQRSHKIKEVNLPITIYFNRYYSIKLGLQQYVYL